MANQNKKSILSKKDMEKLIDEKFRVKKARFEYDNHNIRKEWYDLMEIIDSARVDLDLFLYIKSPGAGVRTRKRLYEMRRILLSIAESIQCQRQDNKSEYE
jgi:hypothetical protein